MKGEVKSTRFSFVLDSEQTLKNIDHLKMVDYARFKLTNSVGTEILALAKEDEWKQLDKLADTHHLLLPFLKLEIQDAFLCALNLRNTDTIKYFLENGFKIASVAEDAPLTLAYSLEYLRPNDAPVQLLQSVLAYGANPRLASDRESQTPLHLAAQYGNIPFLQLLLAYGADVNAVNDDRETPLGCAIKYKKHAAADFLKQRGGNERWDQ